MYSLFLLVTRSQPTATLRVGTDGFWDDSIAAAKEKRKFEIEDGSSDPDKVNRTKESRRPTVSPFEYDDNSLVYDDCRVGIKIIILLVSMYRNEIREIDPISAGCRETLSRPTPRARPKTIYH
jgi:hypothetical protein